MHSEMLSELNTGPNETIEVYFGGEVIGFSHFTDGQLNCFFWPNEFTLDCESRGLEGNINPYFSLVELIDGGSIISLYLLSKDEAENDRSRRFFRLYFGEWTELK